MIYNEILQLNLSKDIKLFFVKDLMKIALYEF